MVDTVNVDEDAKRYMKTGILRLSFAVVAIAATAMVVSMNARRQATKNLIDSPLSNWSITKPIIDSGIHSSEIAKCQEEAKLDPAKAPLAEGRMAILRRIGGWTGVSEKFDDAKRTPDQLYLDCIRREAGTSLLSWELVILLPLITMLGGAGVGQAWKGAAFVHLSRKTARRRPYFKFKDPKVAEITGAGGEPRAGEAAAGEGEATIIPSAPYTATFTIGDGFKPIISVELPSGQSVYAERGALLARSDDVDMSSYKPADPDLSGLNRFLMRILRMSTGEGLVLMRHENKGAGTAEMHMNADTQTVFSVQVDPGTGLIVQRGSFFAANGLVNLNPILVRDLSFMVLGGQGMFLQSIQSDQEVQVLLESPGHVLRRDLKDGETLNVQPSSFFGATTSVSLALSENKGLAQRVKSGEDRFYVAVRGPGTVWMQTERAQREKSLLGRLLPG